MKLHHCRSILSSGACLALKVVVRGANVDRQGVLFVRNMSALPVYHYDGVPDQNLHEIEEAEVTRGTSMSWSRVPSNLFKVRDANYLTSQHKKKQPSKPGAFEIVSIKVIRSESFVYNLAENLASLKAYLASYPNEFFMIVARICPTTPKLTCVHITRRILPKGEDEAFDRLFDRFVAGDDAYRNRRFKYMAKIVQAPLGAGAALRAVGGERPALLGNGYLAQHHYTGSNYIEVNVDIGSSNVAKRIAGSALSVLDRMLVKEAFLIEPQEADELPERVLFSNGYHKCNIKRAGVNLSQEDVTHFSNNPFEA